MTVSIMTTSEASANPASIDLRPDSKKMKHCDCRVRGLDPSTIHANNKWNKKTNARSAAKISDSKSKSKKKGHILHKKNEENDGITHLKYSKSNVQFATRYALGA